MLAADGLAAHLAHPLGGQQRHHVAAAVARLRRLGSGEQVELQWRCDLSLVWQEMDRLSPGGYGSCPCRTDPAGGGCGSSAVMRRPDRSTGHIDRTHLIVSITPIRDTILGPAPIRVSHRDRRVGMGTDDQSRTGRAGFAADTAQQAADGETGSQPGTAPGLLAPLLPAGEPVESLLRRTQFFVPGGRPSADFREVHRPGGRGAEEFYRERWRHDKVVRSTHGVNCTGSCSWKVYVKDGIITWETQQTDYPSTGPDSPEYEPRGCPRGASFSWYTYSPSRVRYPYVRGELLAMWREARSRLGDSVAAWAEITGDPQRAARYKSARGKGGFVRSSWPEVTELIAAAHVHTISEYGPDRVVGFSPIPAMSQVSYSAGTRFLSMIGGTILSFYDWYADMPVASPQVFGDQTDVPESGDWWNSSYLIIWGTNLPITRTPDAHFMTEARYRGQKVVVVSPDYSDHTKFADDWLAAAPGTDGALAMAMGHVILSEFFRDRQVPYFTGYAKTYTDLPFLVTLREREDA
jgi:nitrate reductase alpha subunit